ncbi:glycosyltransferase family 2 protein [Snuella sedimenti]|uniref:Glycosyltransferase family 2 protein n=1 Tax=Snuella sedimenti TaxID=2798802 RepID=A0A8J7IVT7_9FLAO|nr:glycosyltransferase family 2 protein [Snuella sedimenti]MBJ6367900.1 glycosyltransferase family 2 protein [Snuella sedimenti]
MEVNNNLLSDNLKSLKLSVIILNYNSSIDTLELYRSLTRFNLSFLNIFIIDNNSKTKDLLFLKQNIPQKNLLQNDKNLGYGGGNKIGIEIARQKKINYALLLNPDIRLEKETLIHLLKLISSNEEIAAVGPRICFRDTPDIIYSDGGLVNTEKGFESSHINYKKNKKEVNVKQRFDIDYVNGSCLMINIKALHKIGVLLDTFFMYYEETEWCLRAKSLGYKICVDSKVEAFHETSQKKKNYYFYMTRNRILIAKRFNHKYFKTVKIVLKNLLKEFKKTIIVKGYKSPYLYYKVKGFFAGLLFRIEKYEGFSPVRKK